MNISWKNILGTKINPAKEATLTAIKAQSDLLTFDAGSNPANLKVNIAAGTVGELDASAVRKNPATEGSFATIRAKTDLLTFDTQNGLKTTGTAPALASVVSIKDTAKASIHPAESESAMLWRRMVKLLESHATVDATNAQRVSLDAFGSTVTGVGPGGDGVPLVTMASDLVRVIPGISTPTVFMGAGSQVYQDYARDAYARGIRKRLIFS